jgi:leader peptidase (prepilin peptidase)/N-methyltransferase
MTVIYIILSALLGLVVGSFLNVCIDRLPARKSLAYPPSHCDTCNKPLQVHDLVPVASYLWLRGKCRYCGAPIPQRVLWVEIFSGAAFAFLFWMFGLTWEFPLAAFYTSVLLVLAMIDLQHKLILNVIVYPVAIIALIVGFFIPEFDIYKGVLGGAIGFAVLLLPGLISRGGMGWGDIKLAALIGLMVGYPVVFPALFIGIIIGGIAALVLLVTRKKTRKDFIPFGPSLAAGAFIALVYGKVILDWYLSLFS